jgi:hypothetical protein
MCFADSVDTPVGGDIQREAGVHQNYVEPLKWGCALALERSRNEVVADVKAGDAVGGGPIAESGSHL